MPLPRKVSMQNTPRVFLSLEKAHETPHVPFKELAANARDAGASVFDIRATFLKDQGVLLILDNGTGPIFKGAESPTFESFKSMMMGHSLSEGNNKAIGQNGSGFRAHRTALAP